MQELDNFNFEEVKSNLIRFNWDKQKVIEFYKNKDMIKLAMTNCANPSEQVHIQVSKNAQTDGMAIITQLTTQRPLTNQNQSYNIYRDQNK